MGFGAEIFVDVFSWNNTFLQYITDFGDEIFAGKGRHGDMVVTRQG